MFFLNFLSGKKLSPACRYMIITYMGICNSNMKEILSYKIIEYLQAWPPLAAILLNLWQLGQVACLE